MNEGERKTLQQTLRDAWMGVMSGAETEATRAAQKLFEVVGLRQDGEPPPSMKAAMLELAERVKHNGEELERRVEAGVRAAVARVHAPFLHELETMRGRLEQIQQRVEALRKRDADKQPPVG